MGAQGRKGLASSTWGGASFDGLKKPATNRLLGELRVDRSRTDERHGRLTDEMLNVSVFSGHFV